MRTLRNLAFVVLMCIVFLFKGSSIDAQYQTCTASVTTGCWANQSCGAENTGMQDTWCEVGCGAGWTFAAVVNVSCGPATFEQCGGNQTYNYASSVQVQCSRSVSCDDACQCAANGGSWNPDPNSESYGCNYSPILINVSSNAHQYHLTSAADGVLFDINGDGVLEQVAWTRRTSPVGFLARDINRNGVIDSGRELFGTSTRMNDGTLAPNGFVALRELDVNGDGRVDSDDRAYRQLRLWFDANHNGISEPGELVTLPQSGVVALFTSYRESKHVDNHGNAYKYVGTALLARDGEELARRIFDVFLTTLR